MKVKLNTELKDFEGNAMVFAVAIAGQPATDTQPAVKAQPAVNATLGKMMIESLLATFKDEENLSGEEKLKRWQLAIKIKNNAETAVEMTVEEIALIKKLIGKAYSTIIVGQVWELLEGAE